MTTKPKQPPQPTRQAHKQEEKRVMLLNVCSCFPTSAGHSPKCRLVQIVNAHEELVEALKEVKAVFEASGAVEPFKAQYELVCKALAKADGSAGGGR